MTDPQRLSVDQAADLLRSADIADLLGRADQIRRARHGAKTYFVHSLNINPTNVCENRCDLCAFWRNADAEDAYVMTLDDVRCALEQADTLGLTDVHVVGGLTEKLDLAWYESLIRLVRELLPSALVQGMTAVEVDGLARREGLSVGDVLRRLREAGLGAIPGGGAEIFNDRIRSRICKDKMSADRWLNVHRCAHELGIRTNATMLFGHVETPEDIVDHLSRLRDLQDQTGGFEAFIPLPFQPAGTKLPVDRAAAGHTIARVVAVARMFLDNFPHVRVLANYMDRKLIEVLLHSGADDVGGTSLDERIALAAGAGEDQRFTSIADIEAFLGRLGMEAVLVNSLYEPAPFGLRPQDRRQARSNSGPLKQPGAADSSLLPAAAKALACAEAGDRLSAQQAIALHDQVPFQRIGAVAHQRRLRVIPAPTATFVIDRNISLTNVCEARCRFCAYHVEAGSDESFTLSIDEVVDKVTEAAGIGATQVLIQGGLNPDLDLGFYERMLSSIKQSADICVHSLSPPEVHYLSRQSGVSIRDVLQRLAAAGLDSLPGGGAEILVDDVRRRVSPQKISSAQWLEVMKTAHELGMKTTATMVYGLGETTAQRVQHLLRIRDLQDQTGGFTAFIPWSFQPERTDLPIAKATGVDYLRIVALARLVLDNIDHVQAGWVTEGPDLAQLALSFGADDFGGVLMEEKVVRATGVSYSVTVDEVVSLIAETGMTPAQRTTQYEILRVFDQAS